MIPIAIVAHPKREAMAHQLGRVVNADVLCWDVTRVGAEGNHLNAWRWLAELPSEWGVVLEDDVIPCEGFTTELAKALHFAPTSIVSLYLPRERPPHWQESIAKALPTAIEQGASWLTAPAMMSCQGYAMRTGLFDRYERIKYRTVNLGMPIDEAITDWLSSPGVPVRDVSYTIPSLIDHRDGPTLVDHSDGPRGGPSVLRTWDSDPTGADIPAQRKAWLFSAHNNWDSTRLALDIPLTPKEGDNS